MYGTKYQNMTAWFSWLWQDSQVATGASPTDYHCQ